MVFPGIDGTFTLYDDEGQGWGYETGVYPHAASMDRCGSELIAGDAREVRVRLVERGRGW
jgi:hypothetical protein